MAASAQKFDHLAKRQAGHLSSQNDVVNADDQTRMSLLCEIIVHQLGPSSSSGRISIIGGINELSTAVPHQSIRVKCLCSPNFLSLSLSLSSK